MLIFGHRGDRKKFPDNSLEGIKSAFERGADGVEIDVFYSQKKGLYLTHQYLHDLNSDYPSLEEVIEMFHSRGLIQIEVKFPEIEGIEVMKKIIGKRKTSSIVITSSVFPILHYLREAFPKHQLNLLASKLIQDWWTEEFGNYFLFNYLKLTGADTLDTGTIGFWTKGRVKYFHSKGVKTCGHLYGSTAEEYRNMDGLGLYSCTSDDLDILRWHK